MTSDSGTPLAPALIAQYFSVAERPGCRSARSRASSPPSSSDVVDRAPYSEHVADEVVQHIPQKRRTGTFTRRDSPARNSSADSGADWLG